MKPLVVIYSYMVQPELALEQTVLSGLDAELRFVSDDAEFEAILQDLSILILANPVISADQIGRMKRCKAIIRRGIGYDNIDIAAATARGITVCNVPDYCYDEVADHALALMLTLIKRVAVYDSDVRAGRWHIDSPDAALPLARGLQNMTLGLWGFGQIARQVARKGRVFFRDVIACTPHPTDALAAEYNVKFVSREELFQTADVVSLHLPGHGDTHHVLNQTLFDKMKPGAYLINTGRGSVIDENDLRHALKHGPMAGAAIDVTEFEPLDEHSELRAMKNLIITPHIAFYSQDSFSALRRKAAEEARRLLLEEGPLHRVN